MDNDRRSKGKPPIPLGRRVEDQETWGIDPITGERPDELYVMISNMYQNKMDITSVKHTVDSIKEHELKHIKEDVTTVHKVLDKVEGKIDKVDARIWVIIMTVIGSVALPIFLGQWDFK